MKFLFLLFAASVAFAATSAFAGSSGSKTLTLADSKKLNQEIAASREQVAAAIDVSVPSKGAILKAEDKGATARSTIAEPAAEVESTGSPKRYQAEMLRSASGSTIDEKGFSQGTVPIKKGDIFPVIEQTFFNVILQKDGKRFKVSKSEVKMTELNASTETAPSDDNSIRIISAKYGRPNDHQYELRDEIRKRLPKGPLTAPVRIPVNDGLLRSRASRVAQRGFLASSVTMEKVIPCVLTITYEYSGQRLQKEVREGSDLVLP